MRNDELAEIGEELQALIGDELQALLVWNERAERIAKIEESLVDVELVSAATLASATVQLCGVLREVIETTKHQEVKSWLGTLPDDRLEQLIDLFSQAIERTESPE